jgi:DNA-binding LytR/AlgR family response regulator
VKKELLINTFDAEQCLRLTHRSQIPTNEIIYLESAWNYTNIYTSDNRKHLSSFTLKILEARMLKNDFIRINRGCLVNPKHITQITGLKRNAQAQLSNGSVLTISRRKFENIKNSVTCMVLSSDGERLPI